ncbi:HTH-type transcriptional regulator malT [Actinoplanes sp. SE50]|uniref:AAA family ATPase n=1 Tax=unclassified Actinoplanes TaxID=2626549 RepID=UPI00023EC15E|nr:MULTISPECIES: LuxR family transcriptional regulator [unclassified Actinoplanes]AEV86945.1 HTH-type transcriptional regulator malT [Actinoplanes sp. SE50/110]ATO85341.1 HTH-type transcriptional regulator malT [Actinoplanes sp. SE50]SLM02752.1 LuxR-family transcriptional regulator [Actinoplanes sp. SE50/110]
MEFIEIGNALERLLAILAVVAHGLGRLVLVSGGLGSGKSTLLHRFWREAGQGDAVFLSASGSVAESGLQFGVVEQLFVSGDLPGDLADRVLLRVGEAAGQSEEAPDPEALTEIARESCAALLALSRERTVVVLVDDLQFVDQASREVLLFLARRLRSAPVLFVFSEWLWPQPTLPGYRAELSRLPHRQMCLSALTERTVTRMVERELPAAAAAAVAPAIYRQSAGNPLLVAALLDEYRARPGSLADGLASGRAFGQAVVASLRRWGPWLLDVVQALVVLGDRATAADVSRLCGVRVGKVQQVLEIMTSAGLVEDGRLRHVAASDAVLDSMPPDRLARLNGQAAEVLLQAGDTGMRLAEHLVAAGAAETSWAVTALLDGAERALAADRVEFAMQCLELALRGSREPERKAVIGASIVRAAWRIQPSLGAPYREHLRTAALTGGLSDTDVFVALRQALWQGDLENATATYQALTGPGRHSDPQVAARARLAYQWVHGPGQTLVAEADQPDPRTGDDLWSQAAHTLGKVWGERVRKSITISAEHVLRSSPLGDTTIEAIGTALLALTLSNRAEEAAVWCDRLIDEARRRGARTWQAVLSSLRARIALHRGELGTAVRLAEDSLRLMQPSDWGICVGLPLGTLAMAQTALGRHEEAEATLHRPVPDAMFGTRHGLWYLRARGHHHLACDRLLAALTDFQDCGRLARNWGMDVPALLPWRSDLAEAYLRLGEPGTARPLVEAQLERAGTADVATRGMSLRILAACGEADWRESLLREAVEALEKTGDRRELSRALVDLSQVYYDSGDLGQARNLARRAEQEAKACEIPLRAAHRDVACHAGAVRGAEPVVPTAAAGDEQVPVSGAVLSGAEIRVARLAGLGHTNREISKKLFLTVSTVEQHLTRVYRKLGITSRAELPAGLAARGQELGVAEPSELYTAG